MAPTPPPRIQFDRADFDGTVEALARCARCTRPLEGSRAEFAGRSLCAPCAAILTAALPQDTARVFWRTVGAGFVVAAALGMILAVVLRRVPSFGWLPAIAAIGIGWSVGRTMQRTAAGAGGRRYQWAGALLVYASIVMAIQVGLFAEAMPWWTVPLMLARPVVFLFVGLWNVGSLMLFLAFIGCRWTWMMLGGGPRVVVRKA